ncbi:hypothetical protein DRO54_03705, partial [Candidatus Bathyarchaeota archaeon]
MSNSKRKLILLIAVIATLSLFAVSALASNTDILSVGFTLIKSTGSAVSDSVSVGFTLIKQAISIVFATINTTFHLSPSPTPTPTPPPSKFYVQITSNNCPVYINQTAYFSATAGGSDLVYPLIFYWDFGDGTTEVYPAPFFVNTSNVTHVFPSYWRSWDVKVTVLDQVFHEAEATVTCCVVRTKTDEHVDTIDDSAYYALLNALVGQTFEGPINESAEPNFIEFGK